MTGCQWRLLPKCFPPYSTVQRFFHQWRADGLLDQINHKLVRRVCEPEGRNASPTAGIIDSQSAKTTEAGGWTVEIIKRSGAAKGFELLPRRRVDERTLARLNRNRRLAKDFGATIENAKAWHVIGSIKLMTRRLVR